MTRSRQLVVSLLCSAVAICAAAVFVGLRVLAQSQTESATKSQADAALILTGRNIFEQTSTYALENTSAKVSCGNCHTAAGTAPTAAPMTRIIGRFPQFNARAGHVINLQDRVRECFVRSENGTPPADDSKVMLAVVAYIRSVSEAPLADGTEVQKGLMKLPEATPDAAAGKLLYASQCAACHGDKGAGIAPLFPPLWGPDSFNDGAGMHQVAKMAAFVKYNMPQNKPGSLTAQQAYDVAAYIHAQPRPAMNPAYAHF
jgi:thiosulfate dehydrogenase